MDMYRIWHAKRQPDHGRTWIVSTGKDSKWRWECTNCLKVWTAPACEDLETLSAFLELAAENKRLSSALELAKLRFEYLDLNRMTESVDPRVGAHECEIALKAESRE